MVQQGMYFQNYQNAQKIDLLLLYVTYDVLICTQTLSYIYYKFCWSMQNHTLYN